MVGILVLHIAAMLFWCAVQLYLPALIAASYGRAPLLESPENWESTPRFVFIYFSNPAALLTIMAGTALFVLEGITEWWLLVKLGLVVGMVATHALMGYVVLRSARYPDKPILLLCSMLAVLFCGFMASIIWVVLAKPGEALA